MKNTNKNFKRLFDYFDGFLAIDKTVDFILKFLGLFSALVLESYLAKNRANKKYLQILSRVHLEVNVNDHIINSIENSIYDSFDFLNTMTTNIGSNELQLIKGFQHITDIQPEELFKSNDFKSIKMDEFLDNALYSELYERYHELDEIGTLMREKKDILRKLYSIYFEMSMINNSKSMFESADYELAKLLTDYNINHSLYHSINILSPLSVMKIQNEKMLKLLDEEFDALGGNREEFYTAADYLSLSTTSANSKNYLKTISYAETGAELLKKKLNNMEDPQRDKYMSYYGQCHNNIVLATHDLIRIDSTFYKDISYNLKEWEWSGEFALQNTLEYLDYYYRLKNKNKFLDYLIKYIDEFDDPQYFIGRINHWRDFMDSDTVYSILSGFSTKYTTEQWNWEINSNRKWNSSDFD